MLQSWFGKVPCRSHDTLEETPQETRYGAKLVDLRQFEHECSLAYVVFCPPQHPRQKQVQPASRDEKVRAAIKEAFLHLDKEQLRQAS
eukprot:5178816-Amphidinium_carterae.1